MKTSNITSENAFMQPYYYQTTSGDSCSPPESVPAQNYCNSTAETVEINTSSLNIMESHGGLRDSCSDTDSGICADSSSESQHSPQARQISARNFHTINPGGSLPRPRPVGGRGQRLLPDFPVHGACNSQWKLRKKVINQNEAISMSTGEHFSASQAKQRQQPLRVRFADEVSTSQNLHNHATRSPPTKTNKTFACNNRINNDTFDELGQPSGPCRIPRPQKIPKNSPTFMSSVRKLASGAIHKSETDDHLDISAQTSLDTAASSTLPRPYSTPSLADRKLRFRLFGLDNSGIQTLEIEKLEPGPFGFYIATGLYKRNKKGIFISRVNARCLSRLISIGDQLLEVDGNPVKGKSLEQVQSLIANRQKIVLKILPVIMR